MENNKNNKQETRTLTARSEKITIADDYLYYTHFLKKSTLDAGICQ